MSNFKVGKIVSDANESLWVRFGLPLKKGMAKTESQLKFHVNEVAEDDVEVLVKSRWSDGSVKWLLVEMIATQGGDLYLQVCQPEIKPGQRVFNKQKNDFGDELAYRSRFIPYLELKNGNHLEHYDSCFYQGSLSTVVSEWFRVPSALGLSVRIDERLVGKLNLTETTINIVNSSSALHRGGCWDLGDPNSVDISNFGMSIELSGLTLEKLVNKENSQVYDVSNAQRLNLSQLSSGGVHENSPVHVNRDGVVAMSGNGYKLKIDDKEYSGSRFSPALVGYMSGEKFSVEPHHFWENFPSSMEVTSSKLVWAMVSEPIELQPGEGKTWRMSSGNLASKASFIVDAEYLNTVDVFLGVSLVKKDSLSAIIDLGVSGVDSFRNKRELIDEYGWRNFGEMYADHEALYRPEKEEIFVSHYNNQYDPVYGLTIQWLATGAAEWIQLAAELKQHVIDVDIYKTELDKAEYNHGLFWHTDHYLPALTATHRTYSAKHTAAYDGHQGGGGPGGQHCYTTGLALHYWLTGDEQSRSAALNLMHWVRCFYNGPDSLLSRFYRFLTIDMKAGQMTNIGLVPAGYKYPLDRGTANYLNALIDGYQIEPEDSLLDEMFSVIRQTLSPTDNLAERELFDIENAWFYIVMLQALARYLLLKEQLQQTDEAYAYSRQSFIHYARWVLENEQPYLTAPEKLEFPNDTWAAQDIRKANVLYYAAYFDPERSQEHRQRAEFFWHYCVDHLTASEERSTTRVLAILMQNQGVREWQAQAGTSAIPLQAVEPGRFPQHGRWHRLIRDSWYILGRFSWRTEWHWLKTRLVR